MKRNSPSSAAGFSLIITLIILVLLSILVVSFITTATLERTTARAFANKAAAEIAAETATNQAISLLTERITQFPDSATVWETLNPPTSTGGYGFEGSVLYYTKHANDTDERNDPNAPRFLVPLVSRGVDTNGQLLADVPVASHASAMGTDKWTDDNSLDLNRPRSNTDTTGWIGPTPDGRKPYRARWIEIQGTASGAAPAAPATPAPGKTISRYAFWVEDESFRVNLNLLDNNLPTADAVGARGSEITENARFDKTKLLPPQVVGLIPIQGLLRSVRAPMDNPTTDINSWASAVRSLRNGWFGAQLFELRGFNHASLPYTDTSTNKPVNYPLGDGGKFLATIYSGGLNMSRHGSQRVNLNGLGFDKPLSATSPTDTEMNTQIEQIVQTIKYHAPKFGQRFYRATAATDTGTLNADTAVSDTTAIPHANIYLHKIAANIRDYIDPDSQPTILTNTGAVAPRTEPTLAMSAHDGANDNWAQGKEAAPFIQETVTRWRSSCDNTTKRYDLQVDYYIEVWNMTNQDVYAKAQTDPSRKHLNNAFMKVADPVGWYGHGGGNPTLTSDNSPAGNPSQGRDGTVLTIDLSTGVMQGGSSGTAAPDGVVFKAGACTVITTDPDDLLPLSAGSTPGTCFSTGGLNKPNTYYCPTITGKRHFAGPVPNPGAAPNKCDGIWAQFRDAPDGTGKNQEDYGTEIIFGNSLGYIDSVPYSISCGGGPLVAYLKSSDGKTSRDDTYGGTLFGNGNAPSQLGDPRTNNEQMTFMRWKLGGTGEPDQTRYFNPTVSDNYRFSLGWPNSRYVFPYTTYAWKDYYKVWTKTSSPTPNDGVPNPTADTAPAFMANENLKSIGQLGDIFDPARVPADASHAVTGARGGGRTFKIGQPDDLVDMSTATAKSQQWASWRLADFFDISSDLFQPGLININGLRRDNGAALRAACYGLTVKSVSQATTDATPTVAAANALNSVEMATVGVQKLITQAVTRLNQDPASLPSYFRERGELSDLAIFNSTSTTDLVSGVKGSDSFDHSREELFRRLAPLITTRGNVFSVYAVGQSITVAPNGTKVVTGEHWVKTTFALLPKKADGTDFQVVSNKDLQKALTNPPGTPLETFIPTDATSRTARFAKPDHYDLQLLQVSNP